MSNNTNKVRRVKATNLPFWGCGAVNDMKGQIKSTDHVYSTWSANVKRCFSMIWIVENRPSYILADMSEDMKVFSNYYQFHQQNYIDGYVLDKDILLDDNKYYSFQTCVFVPEYVNIAFVSSFKSSGLPIGVKAGKNNTFTSTITIDGVTTSQTGFTTADKAHADWQLKKTQYLLDIANRYEIETKANGSFNQGILDKINEKATDIANDLVKGWNTIEASVEGVRKKLGTNEYEAYITLQGAVHVIDTYDTPEEAHKVWQQGIIYQLQDKLAWWKSVASNDTIVEDYINKVINRLSNDMNNNMISIDYYKV